MSLNQNNNTNILLFLGHGVKTDRSMSQNNYSQRRPSTSSSSGSVKGGASMSSVHSSSQGSIKQGLQHQASFNSSNQKLRQMDSLSRPPLAPVAPPVAPAGSGNSKGSSSRVPVAPAPPPPLAPVGIPTHVPEPPSPSDNIPMPPPPPAFNIPTRDYEEGKLDKYISKRASHRYSEDYIINQSLPVPSSSVPKPPPPPMFSPSLSSSTPSASPLLSSNSLSAPPPPPLLPPTYQDSFSSCPSPTRSSIASPPPPPAFFPKNCNRLSQADDFSPFPPPVYPTMPDSNIKRNSLVFPMNMSMQEKRLSLRRISDAPPMLSIGDIASKRNSLRRSSPAPMCSTPSPPPLSATLTKSRRSSRTVSGHFEPAPTLPSKSGRSSGHFDAPSPSPPPPPPLPKSPKIDILPDAPPPVPSKPMSRPVSITAAPSSSKSTRPTSSYIREGHQAVDEIQRSIELELEAMQNELFGDLGLAMGASAATVSQQQPPPPPPSLPSTAGVDYRRSSSSPLTVPLPSSLPAPPSTITPFADFDDDAEVPTSLLSPSSLLPPPPPSLSYSDERSVSSPLPPPLPSPSSLPIPPPPPTTLMAQRKFTLDRVDNDSSSICLTRLESPTDYLPPPSFSPDMTVNNYDDCAGMYVISRFNLHSELTLFHIFRLFIYSRLSRYFMLHSL